MEDIFILSNCDEWKSYASAKIKMATTDICMMYAAIFAEIKNDSMCYKSDDTNDSIAFFLEDIKTGDVKFDDLKYGMVQIMDNVLVENMETQSDVDDLEKYHNELFCEEYSSKQTTQEIEEIERIIEGLGLEYEVDEHEYMDDFER